MLNSSCQNSFARCCKYVLFLHIFFHHLADACVIIFCDNVAHVLFLAFRLRVFIHSRSCVCVCSCVIDVLNMGRQNVNNSRKRDKKRHNNEYRMGNINKHKTLIASSFFHLPLINNNIATLVCVFFLCVIFSLRVSDNLCLIRRQTVKLARKCANV